MVGGFDHFEIMFDDDDRVAGVDQCVQHFQQLADILEMQPGGRFVEDVQRAAGGPLREFLGEFDALRLAAGKRGRLLAEIDIAEAHPAAGCESRSWIFGTALKNP